jgi:Protein of unknown function (DUF2569)
MEREAKHFFPEAGGFLVVLCLALVIVYPASELYAVIIRVGPKLMASHNAKSSALLATYIVIFTSLAMFSVSAGLRLWRVRPGAVEFAKKYLLAYLISNAAYFVFWYLLFRSTNRVLLAEMGWYHLAGPIASVTLWYTYLENSDRIRQTFSELR